MSPVMKLKKALADASAANLYVYRIHGERYCMTQVRIFDCSGDEMQFLCDEWIATGDCLKQANFINRATEDFKEWK